MNNYVLLKPNDGILSSDLRFTITKNAFAQIQDKSKSVERLMIDLSSCWNLLILEDQKKDTFKVYSTHGIYVCKISPDKNSMTIIGFNETNLLQQNQILKSGLNFKVVGDIIVQIKLTEPFNLFYDIVNGRTHTYNQYENVSSVVSIEELLQTFKSLNNKEVNGFEAVDVDEVKNDYNFKNLLNIAENYAILSNELSERKAREAEKMVYSVIIPIEFDRIDRIAYQFNVDPFDENVYKLGTQIEIEDIYNKKHYGEILEINKYELEQSVIIIFNDHFNFTDLSPNGWISISFNTVSRDVQLKAIEKIRDQTAVAKYMYTVLGNQQTLGFEEKNLTDITSELKNLKHPPNDSQMKAIFSGIQVRDAFFVMGPPGTGKTTVILEWVKYFIKHEHKRVLISSQNNKAVDNVLARIADEKDIDIIRIGSESKLQSDVRPYVIENKVKDLSENIGRSTESRLEELEILSKKWSDFLSSLHELIKLNDFLQTKKRVIIEEYSINIAPNYKRLLILSNDHINITEKIKLLEEKLIRKYIKINNYEHKNRGFYKFLEMIPVAITKLLLKQELNIYDSLVSDELKLCDEYRGLKASYDRNLESIKVGLMTEYVKVKTFQDKKVQQSKELLPNKACKIDLFEQITFDEQTWTNNIQLTQKVDAIKSELNTALKISEILLEWKTEISGYQNYALNEIVLESVDLVGATCIGINSQKRFENLDFDVTIIDEAGQIQIHNVLVPMSVSNKIIMLGDHKQIPPSADKDFSEICDENAVDTELLSKSFFEKLYEVMPDTNKIMLDTQYRMPAEIADIISDWFYEKEYKSLDSYRCKLGLLPHISKRPFVIIDTSKEKNRFENKIEGAGSNNPLEAEIVTKLMRHITETAKYDLKELGVITPYKSQVKLIREMTSVFIDENLVAEIVATLDSFQGQERDIIIYSFTKSSETTSSYKRIGFLNELRRLNVAMTRCKKMLILVGDMKFLSECGHMEKGSDHEEIYDQSEKQFSDFIIKMLADVNQGKGEIIEFSEFNAKMKAEERTYE